MAHPERRLFRFGPFELDERLLELRSGERVVELQAKPFFLLLHLLRNADRVVTRTELLQAVWSDVKVAESSLKTALYEVRRALDDTGPEPRYVATLRGKGYRFRGTLEIEERGEEPSTAAGPRPAREQSGFVDREAEMQRLRALLAAARRGDRKVVLLRGPPGIGKTRTAMELGLDAEAEGFEVHVGRTHEGEGAPALWPWRQVLRSIGETRDAAAMRAAAQFAAADLVQIAPELAHHFPASADRTLLSPEQSRFRQLDGVTHFLRNAAHARPMLIVLDDVQWADEASLALLSFIARNLVRGPLLILAVYREAALTAEDERAQLLHRAEREPGVETLVLRGLTRESVALILGDRLPSGVSPLLVDRVLGATGGNPFFVSQIVRLLEKSPTDIDRIPIPTGVQDAVLMRIAECSPDGRILLRAASVIGARFSIPLLREVVDLESPRVLAALGEVERATLVRSDAHSSVYSFEHGVVQEVLYERLHGIERMQLHERVGSAIEKLHASELDAHASELAYHFTRAAAVVGVDRAIRYLRQAAQAAMAVFAYAQATTLYRQALQLLENQGASDAALHCMLLVELGDAMGFASVPLEQVHDVLFDALRRAQTLDDPRLFALAIQAAAAHSQRRGSLLNLGAPIAQVLREGHAAALEQALVRLQAPEDAALRGRVQLSLASVYFNAGDRKRAAALFETVRETADRVDDPALHVSALLASFPSRALDEDRVDIGDLLARATQAGTIDLEASAHALAGYLAVAHGDRAGLDAAGAALSRLEAQTRLPDVSVVASVWRSLCAQLDGRLDDLEREVAGISTLNTTLNRAAPFNVTLTGALTWWLALLTGRATLLIPLAESFALQIPAHLSSPFLARLYVAAGRDPDAAKKLGDFDASVLRTFPDALWLFVAGLSGELCARTGDRRRSAEMFELLLPYASRGMTLGWIAVCTGSVARPLGSLAAVLERWSECDELFERALAYCDAMRSPVLRAWTELDYAYALRAHPRRSARALRIRLVAAAREVSQQLRLEGLLQRVQNEAEIS